MIYQRTLTTKYTVDVFVAGGGPAGVCAAIACARQGKSVFLAESQGCFGGAGTTGLVPSFAVFTDGVNVLASGIGYEIRKTVSRDFPLDVEWAPIRPEELKRAYDKAVTEAGVKYSFFTTVCDVITSSDRIDAVVLASKSGLFAVKASVYIDCTGDGDLVAFGGGKYEKGDKNGQVMPATLCSMWTGIEFGRRVMRDGDRVEEAYRDGVLSVLDRHHSGMGMSDKAHGVGCGNFGHVFDIDATDERSLTSAMVYSRNLLTEYEEYYRRYVPGFENAALIYSGDTLGVRESRRITCDYTLNIDDFSSRAVFRDEIGRYCYPVDIHIKTTDKDEYERFRLEYEKLYRYAPGESYGIPYRSLIPVSFSNLLVAGRCVGTDQKMQASIRVMPGCFITGQAAGCAAALAADSGDVRAVSMPELQSRLKAVGAYLPNA